MAQIGQQFRWWHGTPYGGATDTPGDSGVHVGTQAAAREALNARIGHRADGKDWDGTQEYGKTMIAGKKTLASLGRYATGHSGSSSHPEEDHLPQPNPWTGEHSAPLDAKPSMFPVKIVGPMTDAIHEDFAANGRMKGQIKRGTARRGYYYKNVSEDSGSISAVVPSWDHLSRIQD